MLSNINAKHTLRCNLPLPLASSPLRAQEGQEDYLGETGACEIQGHPEQQETWVLSKVKSKLATSGAVDGQGIDVELDCGVVRLHGMARTGAERDEVVRLVRATEGVDRVEAGHLDTADR